ncbi:VOC family protein [Paenibacillus sp. IB182493]|uniref:VOC family protein n=2 Tax=Paenibacillus arenilitoris TaxID=2772299 RepID=A0A927H8G2_9BACL|nr:VOC family protein [Paenibacillus arenilitoris]
MKAQLTPYIMSENAKKQAEFYKEALGGEILSVVMHGQMPGAPEAIKDKVMHLAMTAAGGNTLFLSDSFEPVTGNRSISMSLTFASEDEARTAFANLAEGGAVKYPFEHQPWGAHYGEVVDPFGVTWQVVKP